MMSRIEMMFSWLNHRSSLISRRVRRQNTVVGRGQGAGNQYRYGAQAERPETDSSGRTE